MPHLRLAHWIENVRRFEWNLSKHLVKEHADFRISLNEGFQFFYLWEQPGNFAAFCSCIYFVSPVNLVSAVDFFNEFLQPIIEALLIRG